MNLSISKNANQNYLAKVVNITKFSNHKNADRLKIAVVDFMPIITDINSEAGIYIYFPAECCINLDFLSKTNSFRDKTLNKDSTKTGFFEKKGRVKAIKLRGEYSIGYILPVRILEEIYGELNYTVNQEFDMIGDTLLCKKYIIRVIRTQSSKKAVSPKGNTRIIDKFVKLHVSTGQLRKNIHNISPDDYISITYKLHGTSGWITNTTVKRKLSLFEKILKFLRVKITDTTIDSIYGSRKVIKNRFFLDKEQPGYYNTNVWKEVYESIKDKVPNGFTIYFEIVGKTSTEQEIQPGYDYGCDSYKVFVYRVAFINNEGLQTDLSTISIMAFCEKYNLNFVPLFYTGLAKSLFTLNTNEHWHQNFIKALENKYTEKDCYMCKNKVPEEGIVLRKEGLDFQAYKLKSFKFLAKETESMNGDVPDMESDN